eukprot:PhM_4_TR5751/c0_g1_i1/m.35068
MGVLGGRREGRREGAGLVQVAPDGRVLSHALVVHAVANLVATLGGELDAGVHSEVVAGGQRGRARGRRELCVHKVAAGNDVLGGRQERRAAHPLLGVPVGAVAGEQVVVDVMHARATALDELQLVAAESVAGISVELVRGRRDLHRGIRSSRVVVVIDGEESTGLRHVSEGAEAGLPVWHEPAGAREVLVHVADAEVDGGRDEHGGDLGDALCVGVTNIRAGRPGRVHVVDLGDGDRVSAVAPRRLAEGVDGLDEADLHGAVRRVEAGRVRCLEPHGKVRAPLERRCGLKHNGLLVVLQGGVPVAAGAADGRRGDHAAQYHNKRCDDQKNGAARG